MPVQLTPSIARAVHGHETGSIYMYSKKNQYGHGHGHGGHHNTHAPGVVHEKRHFMPWGPGKLRHSSVPPCFFPSSRVAKFTGISHDAPA